MSEVTNIISAFSADQVVRLTRLTTGQLAYWDRTGFFQPHYAADERRSPYSRRIRQSSRIAAAGVLGPLRTP